jgi:predicted Fe-S protein YdhL (DUF1289 family)
MLTTRPEDPHSPCIGVCLMNAQTGLCEGCFRNLKEIAGWGYYSAWEKRVILDKIDERCERLMDDAFFD